MLLVLAERPGQLVGKSELIDRIWPNVVVTDDSLAQAIAEIRRKLGDPARKLVRNVARRGYMLEASAVSPERPATNLPALRASCSVAMRMSLPWPSWSRRIGW